MVKAPPPQLFSGVSVNVNWEKKNISVQDPSLLQQCFRRRDGRGSIKWLHNYPEQNALFGLIWSICDTDPLAGTYTHPFLINESSDERLQTNLRVLKSLSEQIKWGCGLASLITGPVAKGKGVDVGILNSNINSNFLETSWQLKDIGLRILFITTDVKSP